MFIKNLLDCPEFEAGDMTVLREVAHPKNDDWPIGYSLAQARLPIGEASLPHRLSGTELYYILQGQGIMYIDSEQSPVQKGTVLLVPAEAEQYLENTGVEELLFLCIVEPYWRPESESLL